MESGSMSFDLVPVARHEARLAATENVQRFPQIALLRFAGFQAGESAEDFLLPARWQRLPTLARRAMAPQGRSEPGRHRIGRAAFVIGIEGNRDGDGIADFRA